MQGGEDHWGPDDGSGFPEDPEGLHDTGLPGYSPSHDDPALDDPALDGFVDGSAKPVPPGRVWQHPSEVGRQHMVQADRRRGRRLAAALVGVGVGLVAASVVLQFVGTDPVDDAPRVAMSYSDGLVHVERMDSPEGGGVVGLLIDTEGHAVVPTHAIGDSDRVRVLCNGSYTDASVVAADPHSDLAVLELDSPTGPPARLAAAPPSGSALRLLSLDGQGNRKLREVVLTEHDAEAIRANGTMARGLLRATGTTASVGVLLNASSEVVGWVVAEQASPASPDSVAAYTTVPLRRTVARMLTSGTPTHSWIGVKIVNGAGDDAQVTSGGPGTEVPAAVIEGAVVHGVDPTGPAAAAGLVAGDVIVTVDTRRVADPTDLVAAMESTPPGTEVHLGIVRDGVLHSLPVTTGSFDR